MTDSHEIRRGTVTCPIAVIYLARRAEGTTPVRAFVDSYAAHSAGIEHDLIVVLKGFEHGDDLEEARALFAPLPHRLVMLPDTGLDLDSYATAAGVLEHEYICCFNTFSVILGDGWLRNLYLHIALPEVGIVGAMGSYESNRDSLRFMQRVVWHRLYAEREHWPAAPFDKYFDWVLTHLCASAPAGLQEYAAAPRSGECGRPDAYAAWWKTRCAQDSDFAELCRFPAFPNPHIRTNAFMMRRQVFLIRKGGHSTSKLDTSRTESGPEGITRELMRDGLDARVVGKNGTGYGVSDWPKSGTFRLGTQGNLMVADNRSREFAASSAGWQTTHAWLSWGSPSIRLPDDFPRLDMDFQGAFASEPLPGRRLTERPEGVIREGRSVAFE